MNKKRLVKIIILSLLTVILVTSICHGQGTCPPPDPPPPDGNNGDDTNGGGGDQCGDYGGGGCEPLPVTLSSFTCEYVDNLAILYWITQSEFDNMGWNIYRGKNDDSFTNAVRINNKLIEGYGTTTLPHEYVYQDPLEGVVPGDTCWYWLESIDLGGEIKRYNMVAKLIIPDVTEPEIPAEIPIIYGLYQNLPNPFNLTNVSKTRVFFCLHTSADVKINIYNIKGQLVKCIYDKYTEFDDDNPQPRVACWDGTDEQGKSLSAGVYLYRLFKNDEVEETKKLILMR